MSATAARSVSARTLLRLGRVSNLPTVWTNVLAATALAGGDPLAPRTGVALVAMTLFYIGGMYLNDASDHEIDFQERPSRPIPAGEISTATVLSAGIAMLAGGIGLMSLFGFATGLAGLGLAGAIVIYDLRHKNNPFSPVVMGLCRALVYVGAALIASGTVSGAVLVGAVALLAHVVGLTYAAKQESLDQIDNMWPLAVLAVPLMAASGALTGGWPAIPAWFGLATADWLAIGALKKRARPGSVSNAVAALIAAISLVDAVLASMVGAWPIVIACWGGFALTRLAHKAIPGT